MFLVTFPQTSENILADLRELKLIKYKHVLLKPSTLKWSTCFKVSYIRIFVLLFALLSMQVDSSLFSARLVNLSASATRSSILKAINRIAN